MSSPWSAHPPIPPNTHTQHTSDRSFDSSDVARVIFDVVFNELCVAALRGGFLSAILLITSVIMSSVLVP